MSRRVIAWGQMAALGLLLAACGEPGTPGTRIFERPPDASEAAGARTACEALAGSSCVTRDNCPGQIVCDPEAAATCKATVFCTTDAACQALAPSCAVGRCTGCGGCVFEPVADCCADNADCHRAGPCEIARCEAGRCVRSSAQGPCDDGEACTAQDHCEGGRCVGTPLGCAPCERCEAEGCVLQPGFCHIEGVCQLAGADRPAQPCQQCAPDISVTGWSAVTDSTPCEAACGPGTCQASVCAPPVEACDDQNPCTHDSCTPAGCAHDPTPGPCDDADPCTLESVCVAGLCAGTPGAAMSCDDNLACTVDTCVPGLGCVFEPKAEACDDGDPCTVDACVPDAGGCVHPGEPSDCDDGDPCTVDTCVDGGGCAHAGACCGLLGVHCPPGFPCTESGTCANASEVYVPPGLAFMGGTTPAYLTNMGHAMLPPHMVQLSGFAIDRSLVTVQDYAACVDAGACPIPKGMDDFATQPPVLIVWQLTWGQPDSAGFVANGMGWDGAAAYCAWKGESLPTEAQWEKAAIGGCEFFQDCEARVPMCPEAGEINCYPDGYPNENEVTYGVDALGQNPAWRSPYGMDDTLYVAQQWVSDFFSPDYYCAGPEATCVSTINCTNACSESSPPYASPWIDPTGPTVGIAHFAKAAWASPPPTTPAEYARTRYVALNKADVLYMWWLNFGFRCARELAP